MGTAAPPEREVTGQTAPTGSASAVAPQTQMLQNDPRLTQIREHFQRYRDFTAQGKWAEAGKELKAIQAILGK